MANFNVRSKEAIYFFALCFLMGAMRLDGEIKTTGALQSIAGLKNNDSECRIGRSLEYDRLAEDLLAAEEHYRRGAESGSSCAQTALGLYLLLAHDKLHYAMPYRVDPGRVLAEGEFSEETLKTATVWFKRGALSHDPAAAYYGIILSTIKVAGDIRVDLFLEQLQDEAVKNECSAQYFLSNLCDYGWGLPRNEEKSVLYLQQASEGGFAPAMYNLSMRYLLGRDLASDLVKSLYWLEKAADLGIDEAQFELGERCRLGYGGAGIDKTRAVLEYLKAGRQGYYFAEVALADIYALGDGAIKDPVKASFWRQKADQQHVDRAGTLLGPSRH